MSIRFAHDDARPMGRNTRGVKGIKLAKDDYVVGMVTTQDDGTLLSVCENGYGKRTSFGVIADESDDDADEVSSTMRYRRQKRGGKGLRDIRTTERNGKVVDILSITEDDDILMVTSQGKIQRIHGKDISVIGRNTQGVRLIRLGDGDTLAGCASIPGELSGDDDEDLGGPAVAPVESDSAEPSTDVETDDEDAIGEEE